MGLLAELVVPTDAFVLHEAVEATPSLGLEFERVVPTTESTAEYLWAQTEGTGGLVSTLEADPSVDALESVVTAEKRRLFRVEWDPSVPPLFERLESGDETLVRGELRSGSAEWTLSFRFDSRDALEDFRGYCRRRGVDFRLVRLTDEFFTHSTGYDVSPKQREAMVVAHAKGYFDIPRETTLSAVADALDISTRAASERLRRGQSNLLENTLFGGAAGEGSEPESAAGASDETAGAEGNEESDES